MEGVKNVDFQTKLCSLHFPDDSFYEKPMKNNTTRKRLHKEALPTILEGPHIKKRYWILKNVKFYFIRMQVPS